MSTVKSNARHSETHAVCPDDTLVPLRQVKLLLLLQSALRYNAGHYQANVAIDEVLELLHEKGIPAGIDLERVVNAFPIRSIPQPLIELR